MNSPRPITRLVAEPGPQVWCPFPSLHCLLWRGTGMESGPHFWFHTTPRRLLGRNTHRISWAPKVAEASSSPSSHPPSEYLTSLQKTNRFSPWGITWECYKESSSLFCSQYLPPQAEKVFRILTRTKQRWPHSVLFAENWEGSGPKPSRQGCLGVVSSQHELSSAGQTPSPHTLLGNGGGAAGDKRNLQRIAHNLSTASTYKQGGKGRECASRELIPPRVGADPQRAQEWFRLQVSEAGVREGYAQRSWIFWVSVHFRFAISFQLLCPGYWFRKHVIIKGLGQSPGVSAVGRAQWYP